MNPSQHSHRTQSQRRLLLAVLVGVWASFPLCASFRINAGPEAFPPDTAVFLAQRDIEERRSARVAESKTEKDGSLEFASEREPGLYELAVGEIELPIAPAAGQELTLAPDQTAPYGYRVEGSPDTLLVWQYEQFRVDSLERLVYPVREDVKKAKASGADEATITQLTQLEVQRYQEHLRELNDFVLDTVGTSVALYATSLRWNGDYRGDELARLVEAFAERHGEIEITRKMRERIEASQRVAIGSVTPELSGEGLDGTRHQLSDLRGKYVLVDFWAAWCPPCRLENRHYSQLLSGETSEDFAIFAVNLDNSKRAWQRASKQDRVSWTQISDLQGWNSPLASLYNVTALPSSFLIDPNGRIIAKNLRGDALNGKLFELGLLQKNEP